MEVGFDLYHMFEVHGKLHVGGQGGKANQIRLWGVVLEGFRRRDPLSWVAVMWKSEVEVKGIHSRRNCVSSSETPGATPALWELTVPSHRAVTMDCGR